MARRFRTASLSDLPWLIIAVGALLYIASYPLPWFHLPACSDQPCRPPLPPYLYETGASASVFSLIPVMLCLVALWASYRRRRTVALVTGTIGLLVLGSGAALALTFDRSPEYGLPLALLGLGLVVLGSLVATPPTRPRVLLPAPAPLALDLALLGSVLAFGGGTLFPLLYPVLLGGPQWILLGILTSWMTAGCALAYGFPHWRHPLARSATVCSLLALIVIVVVPGGSWSSRVDVLGFTRTFLALTVSGLIAGLFGGLLIPSRMVPDGREQADRPGV